MSAFSCSLQVVHLAKHLHIHCSSTVKLETVEADFLPRVFTFSEIRVVKAFLNGLDDH